MQDLNALFAAWAHSVNVSAPHPLDQERFYNLIAEAYRQSERPGQKMIYNAQWFEQKINEDGTITDEEAIEDFVIDYEQIFDFCTVVGLK